MPHSVTSDLGLHYLLNTLLEVSRLEWLKKHENKCNTLITLYIPTTPYPTYGRIKTGPSDCLGPVVQSNISLISLLMNNVAKVFSNTLLVLLQKCEKLLTFLQQKISVYLPYFKKETLISRLLTTLLSFEQLGPDFLKNLLVEWQMVQMLNNLNNLLLQ